MKPILLALALALAADAPASAGESEELKAALEETRGLLDMNKPRREFERHSGDMRSVAFSSDGSMILSASHGNVFLWGVDDLEFITKFEPPNEYGGFHGAQLSPKDETRILTASTNWVILWRWNQEEGALERVKKLDVGGDGAEIAIYSTDGSRIVTAHGKSAIVWDADGNKLALIEAPGDIHSVSINPEGSRLVTVHRDGSASVWEVGVLKKKLLLFDVIGGKRLLDLPKGNRRGAALFSPDGSKFLTLGGDFRLRDASNWQDLGIFKPEQGVFSTAAFSRDGSRIAAANDKETVVFNARTGEIVKVLPPALCVGFSPEGTYLATGGIDRVVRVWKIAFSSQELKAVEHRLKNKANAADPEKAKDEIQTAEERFRLD